MKGKTREKESKKMKVYHSSNVKIEKLKINSHVTPNKEISKCFGKDKPGDKHWLHVFEAQERYTPSKWYNGRLILDLGADLIGELDRAFTEEGEGWTNYITAVELIPIEIIEY